MSYHATGNLFSDLSLKSLTDPVNKAIDAAKSGAANLGAQNAAASKQQLDQELANATINAKRKKAAVVKAGGGVAPVQTAGTPWAVIIPLGLIGYWLFKKGKR